MATDCADPQPVRSDRAPGAARSSPTGGCCWPSCSAGGAQIFLAGLGVFSVTGHGASTDSAFSAHRGLGFAMGGAAVIILILAVIARPGTMPLTWPACSSYRPSCCRACWRAWPTTPPCTAACTLWTAS